MKAVALYNGSSQIGNLLMEYQVAAYDDVRVQSGASVIKANNRKYLIACTQRINIFNPTGLALSPSTNLTSYDNYPVLLNTFLRLQGGAGLSWRLLGYSPQTVNTTVESSGSTGTDKGVTSGSSTSYTVGSMYAQTNTYGVGVGITPEGPAMTEHGEHSSTRTSEQSTTNTSESSSSASDSVGSSSSMSIKDWGAYALVNAETQSPTWTFGQEYPWNAIDCRRTNGAVYSGNSNQTDIVIPVAMAARLFDGTSLYPPSQLSMFGLNFVMKALWEVTVDNTATSDELTIEHSLYYYSGSHASPPSGVGLATVYMDKMPTQLNAQQGPALSSTVNLALVALVPVGVQSRSAIIGFIPNKFVTRPTPGTSSQAAVPFKIASTGNDLIITDTTTYHGLTPGGFSASATALTASFGAQCTSLSMTLYFKVIDTVANYTLYLKHWKTGTTGVVLTLKINGDSDCVITKYVDDLEAEGGDSNLLTVALRNLDYASIDYHDYLQLGLNAIEITIQPIGGASVSGAAYQIRAISVEKA